MVKKIFKFGLGAIILLLLLGSLAGGGGVLIPLHLHRPL